MIRVTRLVLAMHAIGYTGPRDKELLPTGGLFGPGDVLLTCRHVGLEEVRTPVHLFELTEPVRFVTESVSCTIDRTKCIALCALCFSFHRTKPESAPIDGLLLVHAAWSTPGLSSEESAKVADLLRPKN